MQSNKGYPWERERKNKSLSSCVICEKDVSDQAKTCPHCGGKSYCYQREKKAEIKNDQTFIGVLLGLFLSLPILMVIGGGLYVMYLFRNAFN